ncbi:MAG: AMIN domain-containing protein, partial [Gemmatimonadota bacterium]
MTSFLSLLAGLLATMGGPVTGLSIQPAPERTEVVISMEGQAEYRDFTMEGPNRLVLDLLDSHHALPRDNFLDIRRGGIRSIRTSQYSADIVRVVIELDRVVGYQILPGDGELRLVLENSGESFEPWSTGLPAAELQPAREVAGSNAVLPIQVEAQRISLSFQSTPIAEVLFTFAEFADRSIVPGADVEA